MKAKASLVLLIVLIAIALLTARYTNAYDVDYGQVYGIAWDFGGIDTQGLYLCPAAGHIETDKNGHMQWIRDWTNPIAPYFPELVTDC
jgi:hypothetical protein